MKRILSFVAILFAINISAQTSIIKNGDLTGDDMSSFQMKEYSNAPDVVKDATILKGGGPNGSNCIVVQAAAKAEYDWDSQFWIVFNEEIYDPARIKIKFQYKASSKTHISTQAHRLPGEYNSSSVVGYLFFTEDWQTFEATISVRPEMATEPSSGEVRGFKSIAFQLAKDKDLTFNFANLEVTLLDESQDSQKDKVFQMSTSLDSIQYALYKQVVDLDDMHTNPDGWVTYRSQLLLDVTKNGITTTHVVDDEIYLDNQYGYNSQRPCMQIDKDKRQIQIFCNSKDAAISYSMDGFFYSSSLDSISFKKEQVFDYANWGWWPYFLVAQDGSIAINHFSYAGYYNSVSTRDNNGVWNTNMNYDITPDEYVEQYFQALGENYAPAPDTNYPEPYAVLSDSNTVLTFYYDEKKAERNGMDVKPTTYTYENDEIKDLITPDWYDYRDNIKTVVFDASFANCTTLTSTAFWFFGCINLTTITGISNLKTDNVTDMGYMFIGCESLANLDVSGFNTSNVETFYAMFANCSSLRELDLTNFNTAKATHMNGMFFSCSELETIFVGEEWSTAHVTNGSDMFTDCNALVGWEGTRYDENRVDPAYAHVDGGTANPGYFTDKAAMESLRKMLFDMIAQLEMETSVCESLLESKDPERASTLWQDINSIKAAIMDVSIQTEESKTKPKFDECEKYIDVIAHKLNELRHEIENYNNTQEPDPYVDPDIDNSLVAYYPFNGNANDESGHGNNGEVIGHVELVTDRHGNPNGAYRFFGEPFNYISVPDKEILHLNKFTLSAWVYSDAEDYSYGYLINKGRDIEDGAYRLCVKSVGATNEYGGINDAYIEGNPQVGVWHMITGTVEGDQAKYYLDGVLMDERTLSNPFVYMNTEPLTLGMHYYAGVPDMWAYPLLGVLDDVRIYNRVMSSSEIKELYYQENENQSFATFDGLTAWVSGEATLDEAFVEVEGGREAAAQTIAAIVWKNTTPLTTDMLRGINNPNLLIYVEADSLAPQGFKNVVVNGVAKEIVLADATSGNNNWYSPQSFRAEKISYTRNFRQRTEVGISRGWESIALPFTVQTITHATQGLITPFGANGTKHFWLRGYSAEGLRRATVLEANTPYVISMPNDTEVYPYEYNLNGQVTFTAENTTVPATPSVEEMMVVRDLIIMVPTFQYIPVNEYTYAINVGQTRDSYPEGSVFAREFRELRPFEVYTTHGDNHGARPRNIRITAQPNEDITGIKDIENDEFEGDWFTIEGYKMQGEPQRKGIYIQNGKKVKK